MLLQGLLPGSSRVLANSGAVWAVVALAMGLSMRSRRDAVVGGALALMIASFSYYVTGSWFEGMPFTLRLPLVWSVAGIAAGSVLGLAGYVARQSARRRSWAWALIAGGVFGEGVHLTWLVRNDQLRPIGLAELSLAALIACACIRRSTWTKPATAIATSTALATLLAFLLIGRILSAG